MKANPSKLVIFMSMVALMPASNGVKSDSRPTTIKPQGQIIPFDSDRWEITGEYKREQYLGQNSIRHRPGAFAILKDSEFSDGIIEFDIALPETRGFSGVVWRLVDSGNYEEFYMRPHQSGNSDAN